MAHDDGSSEDITEAVDSIENALRGVANAITDVDAIPGPSPGGGRVGCLTEACMGITNGLFAIASSIDELVGVIREGRDE